VCHGTCFVLYLGRRELGQTLHHEVGIGHIQESVCLGFLPIRIATCIQNHTSTNEVASSGCVYKAEESQEARGILYRSHANCSLCNSLQPLLISRSLSPRIAVLRYSLRTLLPVRIFQLPSKFAKVSKQLCLNQALGALIAHGIYSEAGACPFTNLPIMSPWMGNLSFL
jgi:hypothetical protein